VNEWGSNGKNMRKGKQWIIDKETCILRSHRLARRTILLGLSRILPHSEHIYWQLRRISVTYRMKTTIQIECEQGQFHEMDMIELEL